MHCLTPKSALFYITNACNLNCRHCGVRAGARVVNSRNLLTSDTICTLFSKLANLGIQKVSLTGGEVFLRNDLVDVLRHAKNVGIQIGINTNLTFLPSYFEDCVKEKLIYELFISFDGYNERTHDRIRGTGNYKKTKSNISNVVRLKGKYGNGPQLSFITVPTRWNFREIGDIICLAQEEGIDTVRFEHLVPSGNAAVRTSEIMLKGDDLLTAYTTIMHAMLSMKPPRVTANMITNMFIEYYNRCFETSVPYKFFSCTSPQHYIYISFDGAVMPCAAMTEQAGHTPLDAGARQEVNILENEFIDIVSSDIFTSFIKDKTNLDFQRQQEPCNRCKFLGNYCSPCISNLIAGRELKYDLCEASLDALTKLRRTELQIC